MAHPFQVSLFSEWLAQNRPMYELHYAMQSDPCSLQPMPCMLLTSVV